MAVKINKKIVGYSVLDKENEKKEETQPAEIFQLGDPLRIRVKKVDLIKRFLDFVPVY